MLIIDENRTCPHPGDDPGTRCHAFEARAGYCAEGHSVDEDGWIPLPAEIRAANAWDLDEESIR
jgi:hypothetical protein